MSRAAAFTGALLLAFGLAVFAFKVFVYDLPLAPTDARGLWQVALRITVRGNDRGGSVSALLPSSDAGQIVLDERAASDRLTFSIRTRGGQRVGIWSGRLRGTHELLYEFQVQSSGTTADLTQQANRPVPEEVARSYLSPSAIFPSDSTEVVAALESLNLPGPQDLVARVRTLFAFVHHEIAIVPTAGDDALLALGQREGNAEGKERLLVTLLRAAGVPARAVRGLVLRDGAAPGEEIWTQAWVGGSWVLMSSVDGTFGTRPPDVVLLSVDERPLVDSTGTAALGHRYTSLREHLRPEEIAALMAPGNDVLDRLSLYRLPLPTQSALRLLLLLPLGALIVAVFRNAVGVPTYGTFMPVLIALALRGTSLGTGLMLVTLVLGLGIVTRLALERLRLLLVPRLSILLCLVVLTVTGLALLSGDIEVGALARGVLFPIVILTMLVERFSIAMAEEGWQTALVRAGWSVLVAVAVYPAFQSPLAEHLMFSFPELVFCIMGVLVWMGGYTGYRLADLLRFRLLAVPSAPEGG
jgi:transglutaminase-like putative cysteine protease